MEKLDGRSLDLIKTNIEALKQLFPEVVTEGKIDFDKLKLVLGEEIETRNEKYEFTWHGKTQAMKLAQTPSTGTLRPDKASSKNWETTENLYIEGDNLEVLKLLQKSYFGKIKMIYIDPPYNTGKDFVYKDDFRDNIKNYKEITQQTTKANTETNGRYHTDWLNMMYPRLKLARNLLREDGVIFISIDDTEVSNLKKICDEIFGEVNFITVFIWQRAFAPVNMNKFASRNHDFILCYAKQIDFLSWYGLPRSQEADTRYANLDNDPRGPWTSGDLSVGPPVPEKIYEIVTPSGRVVYPPKGYCWRVTKERFAELLADNRIWFGKDGDSVPRLKRFLSEVKSTITPLTVWTYQEVSHSQDAKKELKELFDDQSVMDYPKPIKLMKRILELSTRDNDIILDFFSGSATTAHAVMQLNTEDGGNRKFIMVQLPEKTDETSDAYKAGYKNICEIGKERIRRAGEKIVQETGKTDLDIGFKVFKLDSSNIKEWDPDFDNLEQTLFDLQNNIKEDRTKEDLLYEILLKIGLPLTVPIEEIDCRGKTIYNVAYGSVLVCLEDEIDLDLVQEMLNYRSEHMPPKVIFKESGFMSDAVKTNALQTLKKHGITDVRSV
ncbi:DNA methylase N-4 [Geobacillus thermoleovorans]|uniref:site-specific DNA-methyltransferase n=1 Tax=Geobacillus thermoleovorans TaxID=33941 RepID=UPI00083A900B|nr:site-specific DNA-methyltransferase [Geobacillus thermoleovorans]ODA16798.1 DNA methylase N-4 [Geobacillus thermoleovorans]TLS33846.1 site-specific DNA-methyltransferase [Geobacillus thermoleovorans]